MVAAEISVTCVDGALLVAIVAGGRVVSACVLPDGEAE